MSRRLKYYINRDDEYIEVDKSYVYHFVKALDLVPCNSDFSGGSKYFVDSDGVIMFKIMEVLS